MKRDHASGGVRSVWIARELTWVVEQILPDIITHDPTPPNLVLHGFALEAKEPAAAGDMAPSRVAPPLLSVTLTTPPPSSSGTVNIGVQRDDVVAVGNLVGATQEEDEKSLVISSSATRAARVWQESQTSRVLQSPPRATGITCSTVPNAETRVVSRQYVQQRRLASVTSAEPVLGDQRSLIVF